MLAIETFIISELNDLKFNFTHLGSTYIMESIQILYYNNLENSPFNLEKDVYSIVASKHHQSVQNIKSNICKSSNHMYAECTQDYLKTYFSFPVDLKPTPKLIIRTVLSNVCNKLLLQND